MFDKASSKRHFWRDVKEVDHFVQFYQDDYQLLDSLLNYIGKGLRKGDGCIMIATKKHISLLDRKLEKYGFSLNSSSVRSLYYSFDAQEVLEQFMVNDMPNQKIFTKIMGKIIGNVSSNTRSNVRAFGEMVGLLWERGNISGAYELERLWNDLFKTHSYSLFCGYSRQLFNNSDLSVIDTLSQLHKHVVTSDKPYSMISQDKRLQEIDLLFQRAWTGITEEGI